MNTGTGTEDREKRPGAEAGAKGGELATNALLQQQLQQQQLQLLQLQQQQLASMSPSEIAVMTQQMALFMMPMMPFMMPLNQQLAAGAGAASASATVSDAAASSAVSGTATSTAASATFASTDAMGLGAAAGDAFSSQSSPLSLLGGAQFGNLTPSSEEAPKRKRGRPPKKDVAARAKADAEKTIKQFPMWGYGLPMPLLPGFPGVLPGAAGAAKDEAGGAQAVAEEHKDGELDDGLDKLNASAGEAGKPPKKKSRGTGKPRGRPRTRPRPGEIIHRAKPPPIAPANYSVMYNYSLSNMAQKSPELGGDAAAGAAATSHEDNRLASLSASLLSGDHE